MFFSSMVLFNDYHCINGQSLGNSGGRVRRNMVEAQFRDSSLSICSCSYHQTKRMQKAIHSAIVREGNVCGSKESEAACR